MSVNYTARQLAYMAEAKLWSLLIETDYMFAGLEPSRVRDLASLRLRFLEECLAEISVSDREDALAYGLTDGEKDAAFAAAHEGMKATLDLIRASTGIPTGLGQS